MKQVLDKETLTVHRYKIKGRKINVEAILDDVE